MTREDVIVLYQGERAMTAGSGLNNLTVSFASLTQGTYSGYIDLTPKSINAGSSTDMSNVRLNFSVTVIVPERAPWSSSASASSACSAMCGDASGVVCLALRRCTAPCLCWFLCAIASTGLLFCLL